MKTLKFPNEFLWGGATWAPGCEGARDIDGKSPDVWDALFENNPERFYEQVGPNNTIDMYHRYKEYVQILKEMNMNSFRFNISWARFMPNGTGDVNEKAVEFYSDLIKECKDNGIEPILCLWHFDLPQCMQDIGGWINREVVNHFVNYCKEVLKYLGNEVKYVVVHNEVGVLPQGGYLYDFQPPNVIDFKQSIQCGYNLLLGQAMVINHYHTCNYPGEIGTVLNPNPVYAKSENPEDVAAAKFLDMIRERFYLDVSVKGELPNDYLEFCAEHNLTPEMHEEDAEIFKQGIVDLLGVNYYQPCRVQAPVEGFKPKWYPENDKQDTNTKKASDNQIMPENFYSIYDMPGKRMNFSRGWEIYPQGIYDTVMRLKNEYGNIKFFIGENGMGVENEEKFLDKNGIVQDDYRIEFYEEHLEWLHKAINEGANCIGYNVWAPFDVWSPLNAFKNRYGFYRYNCADKTMVTKKSGQWASNLFKTCELNIK